MAEQFLISFVSLLLTKKFLKNVLKTTSLLHSNYTYYYNIYIYIVSNIIICCYLVVGAAEFIGIEIQKPFLEAQIAVLNGTWKAYPSNGVNFASAGSGVLDATNKDLVRKVI